MHLTPACGASESETIVRSKGLLTQMLSDEPVMPRELDFYRKDRRNACVGDRPRVIPISIWDKGIVGQRLQRRKKEVNASSVQLSAMVGVN